MTTIIDIIKLNNLETHNDGKDFIYIYHKASVTYQSKLLFIKSRAELTNQVTEALKTLDYKTFYDSIDKTEIVPFEHVFKMGNGEKKWWDYNWYFLLCRESDIVYFISEDDFKERMRNLNRDFEHDNLILFCIKDEYFIEYNKKLK